MNDEAIRVTGSEPNINDLRRALAEYSGRGIEISEPRPVRGSLMGRPPLGQVGLFEIVISIIGSIAASAAYDGIKRLIAAAAKDGKVTATASSVPKPAEVKNTPREKGPKRAQAKGHKRLRK